MSASTGARGLDRGARLLPSCAARSGASPTASHLTGGPAMSAIHARGRFTALPDEATLAATAVGLEEHGFSVEVVDDLNAAREAVLARIPVGSSVMTNTSMTLQDVGIAEAIDRSGRY